MQKEEFFVDIDKINIDDNTSIFVIKNSMLIKKFKDFIFKNDEIKEIMLENPEKYEKYLFETKSRYPFKTLKIKIDINLLSKNKNIDIEYNYILKLIDAKYEVEYYIEKIEDENIKNFFKFYKKNSTDAVEYFKEKKPDDKYIIFHTVEKYMSKGYYEKAIKLLDRIKDDEDLQIFVFDLYGKCYESLEKDNEALQYYKLSENYSKIIDIIYNKNLTEYNELLLEAYLFNYNKESKKSTAENIAKMYLKQQNETEAIKWFKLAM